MVTITKNNTDTIFEVNGIHKFLALKGELKIPNSHILKAYIDVDEVKNWHGTRALGSYIPYLLKAGTFYNDADSSVVFMDIVNVDNTIIIELKDETYKKMIIEVANPAEAIKILSEN